MIFDKILSFFLGDIPPEQRAVFTRLLFRGLFMVHIAWACGWLAFAGLAGFAQASEVQKVKDELTTKIEKIETHVQQVENAVVRSQKIAQRTAYETEIRRLDQEIFNAISRIKELQTAGLRVDRIYDERVSDLQSERARVYDRLTAFMRANPDIAGATF